MQKALLVVSDICTSPTAHISGAPSMSLCSPTTAASILIPGCFFVGFALISEICHLKVTVFESESACFKNVTTIRTSDIELCTEWHKWGMNQESSKTWGQAEMLMVCAFCVIFARTMEVDTWPGGKIALFYRLNGSHQLS